VRQRVQSEIKPHRLETFNPSSTVNGILFEDDQALERLRGRFFIGELKM
jgi:hypothetical protein